ncbi:acetamidase/formamidase family protein [Streptomyces sp. NBC_01716]|uniref:acetamidase/formamidase family protein n=1 Tax=Streptomyces sp. NBC_01716 TaxID=2975917 RepID=UPI002E30B916|nr:acetamidase/formamidase family protein [Streptomyces sp. NBC_01716]
MAEHFLDSVPGTVSDVFSRELPPVLTVDPGDTLTVHTLDCSGHLERRRTADETVPRMFDERRGHCLVGPIAVRGAEPGMALSVRLESLRPDAWGFTAAATSDTPLNRRLGIADEDSEWLVWDPSGSCGT